MSTKPGRCTLAWPRRRLSRPFPVARSLPAGTFPPYARFSRALVPTPPLGITWQASPKSPELSPKVASGLVTPTGPISFKEPFRERARC